LASVSACRGNRLVSSSTRRGNWLAFPRGCRGNRLPFSSARRGNWMVSARAFRVRRLACSTECCGQQLASSNPCRVNGVAASSPDLGNGLLSSGSFRRGRLVFSTPVCIIVPLPCRSNQLASLCRGNRLVSSSSCRCRRLASSNTCPPNGRHKPHSQKYPPPLCDMQPGVWFRIYCFKGRPSEGCLHKTFAVASAMHKYWRLSSSRWPQQPCF
jgi:hypothetical protein